MSRDIHRLAELVRTDLERAKPIIETGRLDDLIRLWFEWRSGGPPASSMKGVIRNIGMHSDPTGARASAEGRDPGDMPLKDGIAALEQIDEGLRALIRLNTDAPASKSTCATCGKVDQPDTRRDRRNKNSRLICGACRRRRDRRAA